METEPLFRPLFVLAAHLLFWSLLFGAAAHLYERVIGCLF
jgi:hypothetical protein